MNPFGVSDARVEALLRRMMRLKIREEDLQERFIRSGGPGGQNVNKLNTCVRLCHRPSGVEVKTQQERFQGLNRFLARQLLVQKLETQEKRRAQEEQRLLAKARRQKKRRPRAVQEKVLASKRLRSLKKRFRAKVHGEEE